MSHSLIFISALASLVCKPSVSASGYLSTVGKPIAIAKLKNKVTYVNGNVSIALQRSTKDQCGRYRLKMKERSEKHKRP